MIGQPTRRQLKKHYFVCAMAQVNMMGILHLQQISSAL